MSDWKANIFFDLQGIFVLITVQAENKIDKFNAAS